MSAPDVVDSVGESARQKEVEKLADALSLAVSKQTHAQEADHEAGIPFESSRTLPMLELPGFGDRLEDCGKDLPHFCPACGDTATFGRTCRRSVCPRCGSSWVREQSTSVFKRLLSLLKLEQSRSGRAFPHHLAVSPPPTWMADADDPREALEAGFDAVRGILDAFGTQGVVFYHPWRGSDEERDGMDDRGEWKHRLFSEREWEGDVRDELRPSGHFHVVCVSPFIPGGQATKELYRETGWIVERIADSETGRSIGRSGDIDRDMAGVVSYALSHTGIYETDAGNKRAAYRYVGGDLNGIHVTEDTEERADSLVREVAWKTLGIPSANTTCDAELASSGVSVSSSGSSSSPSPDGSGDESCGCGEHDDEEGVAMSSSGSSGTVEREKCGASLRSIGGAPSKLSLEEWARDAPFAARTAGALLEAMDEEEWVREAVKRSDLSVSRLHALAD